MKTSVYGFAEQMFRAAYGTLSKIYPTPGGLAKQPLDIVTLDKKLAS